MPEQDGQSARAGEQVLAVRCRLPTDPAPIELCRFLGRPVDLVEMAVEWLQATELGLAPAGGPLWFSGKVVRVVPCGSLALDRLRSGLGIQRLNSY